MKIKIWSLFQRNETWIFPNIMENLVSHIRPPSSLFRITALPGSHPPIWKYKSLVYFQNHISAPLLSDYKGHHSQYPMCCSHHDPLCDIEIIISYNSLVPFRVRWDVQEKASVKWWGRDVNLAHLIPYMFISLMSTYGVSELHMNLRRVFTGETMRAKLEITPCFMDILKSLFESSYNFTV